MLRQIEKLEVMKFSALLDEVHSDLENDIVNIMNKPDIEFVSEQSLENELDFDDEPLNLIVPETNYHGLKIQLLKKLWKKEIAKLRKK